MLPAERRQLILDELYKNKAVTVNDLAARLEVTAMTIRRDLQLLEDAGLIEKSHGGAVLSESLAREATYRSRKMVNIEEKRRIAQAALRYIEPAMSVYIDAGTTNYELAELIAREHWEALTVVTNDLAIAERLTPVKGVDVIMLGGHIDRESSSACGALALRLLEALHFDLAIVGTQAITPDWQIMTANADKIDLKRSAIKRADQSILLVDHSKFGRFKLYAIAPVSTLDVLISDYELPAEVERYLAEQKVTYVKV